MRFSVAAAFTRAISTQDIAHRLTDFDGKPLVMYRDHHLDAKHSLPLWFQSQPLPNAEPVFLLLKRPRLYRSIDALVFDAQKAHGNLFIDLRRQGFDGVCIAAHSSALMAELDEEEEGLSIALQNAMAVARNAQGLQDSDLAQHEQHIVRIREALLCIERERAALMACEEYRNSAQQWKAVAFRNDQVIPAMKTRKFKCKHHIWPKATNAI